MLKSIKNIQPPLNRDGFIYFNNKTIESREYLMSTLSGGTICIPEFQHLP